MSEQAQEKGDRIRGQRVSDIIFAWKFYKPKHRWHVMGEYEGTAWSARCVELADGDWLWYASWGTSNANGEASGPTLAKNCVENVMDVLKKVYSA